MDDGSHQRPLRDADNAAFWPVQPVQLARGRQPRDALAKTITFNVSSLDAFEATLTEYVNGPRDEPEHTEVQLSFWKGTVFIVPASSITPAAPQQQQQQQQSPQQQQQSAPVSATTRPPAALPQAPAPHLLPHAPSGYQSANGQYGGPSHPFDATLAMTMPNYTRSIETQHINSTNSTTANNPHPDNINNGLKRPEPKVNLSVVEALQPTSDPKEKMRKQRAIAKCCVDAIQRIDGFRYSFHNCWNSREDDSFRFSYYCNDSLLNKDRAANGKGTKLGKRATKPVYDCKGVLSIKFSATKQTLDVFYKHVPIHKTYEERAPPPRKDSKRRKYLEETDPEALMRLTSRPKSAKAESEDPEAASKYKKKKTTPDFSRPSNTSLESDLRAQSLRSLLELIQVDPTPQGPSSLQSPPIAASPAIAPQVQQPANTQQLPMQQVQNGPAAPRRRPRNSCDICKTKKTKVCSKTGICLFRANYYSVMAPGQSARHVLKRIDSVSIRCRQKVTTKGVPPKPSNPYVMHLFILSPS